MSDFSVDAELVKRHGEDFTSMMNALGRCSSDIENIASQLSITGGGASEIRNSLRIVSGNLEKEKDGAKNLRECLVNSMGSYIAAENLIKGTQAGKGNASARSDGGTGSYGGSSGNEEKKWYEDVHTVAEGGASYTNQYGTTFSASGYALGGDIGAGVDGLAFNAYMKGNVLDGQASVESDYGKVGVHGSVLGGEGKFAIGFTGMDYSVHAQEGEDDEYEGMLAGIMGTASAYVAQGDVEARVGSEKNNINVGADGTVLGAEAEAKAGVFYDNKGIGVGAEASAEAYVAKGEVKGGFDIAGIKFSGSVGGKALAAGAHAGGHVTTGGVNLDAGASLLLGVDLGISVDWSGFDPSSLDVFGWFH